MGTTFGEQSRSEQASRYSTESNWHNNSWAGGSSLCFFGVAPRMLFTLLGLFLAAHHREDSYTPDTSNKVYSRKSRPRRIFFPYRLFSGSPENSRSDRLLGTDCPTETHLRGRSNLPYKSPLACLVPSRYKTCCCTRCTHTATELFLVRAA